MKSSVQSILQNELEFKSGIAYLVPTKWWTQFCAANQSCTQKNSLQFPPLCLDKLVDNFILEFKDSIMTELEHKSNYLKISRLFICPQPSNNIEWTPVSSDMWALINSKVKSKYGLMTVYNQDGPNLPLTSNLIQLQVIFCSRVKCDAFVGFLPRNIDLVGAVRAISYELGFVEMDNSRIMFPDKCPDKPYYFQQLEKISLDQAFDTLLLIYNLECVEEKEQRSDILNKSFGKEDQLGNSNEAMVGDVGALGIDSFELPRIYGTMSTGAETPSFFFSENENREFRVRELFREKKPEEIQQLRNKAKKIVKGELISISEASEEEIERELQVVVLQIMQHISLHNKKSHKEKDNQNQ